MGSDKGSLLEIPLSRKMRLSLLLIIVLVAVSGIQSEDNLENVSDISKESIKAAAQNDMALIVSEKTLGREKREGKKGKKNAQNKWRKVKKEKQSGTVNRSGKKISNKKKGKTRKANAGSRMKMKKSPK